MRQLGLLESEEGPIPQIAPPEVVEWPPPGANWYYTDDAVAIAHGDCRDIMPMLAPASVDLILSDPPYGVSYVSGMREKGDPLAVAIEGDANTNVIRDVVADLDRLLRDDRHIYLFAATMRLGEVQEALEPYWKIKNVLIWDKGDQGTVGDLVSGFSWNFEPIVYAMKGRRPLSGPRPRALYRYDWTGARDPVHPTVKPIGLLKWLLQKSTNLGEVIIDPFMGSGTTLRAAKDLGRRAIGIELNETYVRAAVRRMPQGVLL